MAPGWTEPIAETTVNGTTGDTDTTSKASSPKDSDSEMDAVKEEPMEVEEGETATHSQKDSVAQPITVKQEKVESDESELEEGEIESDEEEDGQVTGTPKKEILTGPQDPHKHKPSDKDNNGRQNSFGRPLTLSDLGLPTSFVVK